MALEAEIFTKKLALLRQRVLKPTLQAIAHTYGYVVDIKIYKINNHISLWAKHRYQERENIYSLNQTFHEYSKSKLLASLNQSIGFVYGNLAYDEDSHLHCLKPTQHSWVLHSNYIKAQVVMVHKATRLPP
jgi:hypothetical protein